MLPHWRQTWGWNKQEVPGSIPGVGGMKSQYPNLKRKLNSLRL